MFVLKSDHDLYVVDCDGFSKKHSTISYTKDIDKSLILKDLSRAKYCRTFVNNLAQDGKQAYLEQGEDEIEVPLPGEIVKIIRVGLIEKGEA